MKNEQIAITLKRSCIGCSSVQKKIAKGLGLNKLHQTVIRKNSPEIMGMVRKIMHLLDIHEVQGKKKKSAKGSSKTSGSDLGSTTGKSN